MFGESVRTRSGVTYRNVTLDFKALPGRTVLRRQSVWFVPGRDPHVQTYYIEGTRASGDKLLVVRVRTLSMSGDGKKGE